ncbi:titin-like isoform X2 [Armigeres subalbatus]|uniref:titin-like isoform X2 n=1 Tax=Armigeres subalbatus TaxID=124917 RepID=UPI002ED4732F
MPLYSELYHNYIGNTPVLPAPLSSTILSSSSYTAPSYVGISRGFQSPVIVGRIPSFSRGYVPKLTPITETPLTSARVTALTRANSSKYHPHTSPTYQKPRRVINTADIDVSASRYVRDHTPKRFLPSSPTTSSSPDRNNNSVVSPAPAPISSTPTTTTMSARDQELMERVEQRRQQSTINRNRAVVRLNTLRARSKSRGSRGSTERKTPRHSPEPEPSYEEGMLLYKEPQPKTTSWRDQFRDELSLRPKKSEPSKSPGELLMEKHLIREGEEAPILLEQIIAAPPVMMRRGTIRRKSGVKIPSFHEICADINSDKLDDDLNAGELRRRASQIIEDEIVQFQQELQNSNGILNDDLEDRLKEALEQQIVESVVEVPEKKKQKKIKRTRTKPLPKIDVDNNVELDQLDTSGLPLKITIDSPTIENSAPPKILAEVESIEECTVFKLPKKKKHPEDQDVTPPKKTIKKATAKTIELESGSPVQKIEVLIIDLPETKVASLEEPTRKLEQPQPPTDKKPEPPEKKSLSDLAERKKILELQRKMDKLTKLTERKLPTEVLTADAVTAKEETTKTETKQDVAVESHSKEEIKPMEKTEMKSEKQPTKEIEKIDPSKPGKLTLQDAAKISESTKDSPGVKDSKDSPKPVLKKWAKETRESSPLLKKNATANDVAKVESTDDTKLLKPVEKITKPKVETNQKLSSIEDKISKDLIVPKNLPGSPKLALKKTPLESSCEVNAKTNKELTDSPKPQVKEHVSKTTKVDDLLKSKESRASPTLPLKKLTPDTPEVSPTPKSSNVFTVPEIPAFKKPALKQTPQDLDLPSDLTPPPTPTKPLKKTLGTAQEPPKPASPKTKCPPPKPDTAAEAVPKASAPEQLPKAASTVAPPAEVPKPKPLLKPVNTRKKTTQLNLPLSPEQQQEEDFWSNIGTRETVSFARRKQNIERRNQMVLLKFGEQQDVEEEDEPVEQQTTSKNVSTKVMASPPAAAAEMPQWPKPAEEVAAVARKAFEVTPVKLEDGKLPGMKKVLKQQETNVAVKNEGNKALIEKIDTVRKEPIDQKKSTVDNSNKEDKKTLQTNNQLEESKKDLIGIKKTSSTEDKEPLKDIKTQIQKLQEPIKSNCLDAKANTIVQPVETTKQPLKPTKVAEKLLSSPSTASTVESKDSSKDLQKTDDVKEEPKSGLILGKAQKANDSPKELPKATKISEVPPNIGIGGLKKTEVVEPKEMTKEPSKVEQKLGLFGLKKAAAQNTKEPIKANGITEELPKTGFLGLKKKIPDVATKESSQEQQKTTDSPNKLQPLSPPNSPKQLKVQNLSPKELIKSVAPTIAAEAEKKLAQVQKTPKKPSPTKQETPSQDPTVKPEATPKGKQQSEPQPAVDPKPSEAEPKKTKIVKKVIKVVKSKSPPLQPDAAKVEEAEKRRLAQENAEKIKAKVNQITLNMGAKLEVEIKDCAKCQQDTPPPADSPKLPVNKQTATTAAAATTKKPSTADDGPKAEELALTKNKFGVVSNLSDLSTVPASDQSVKKQVSKGADRKPSKKQVTRRYSSSSSSEEDEEDRTGSETSFSGIEDDWSSEEEEMANDKPEKKKFDPQKRVKLSFEQMRKCYSKEEKCPIVLVARPRPLWKVKRHGHRHNRHADLTSSSSSGSEDESGSATDQTSSGTASTVDASSDLGTDSSVNSSRGHNSKKKHEKSGSKTSDVGSDIYDNPMVIPLHSEPKGGSTISRDENNNDSVQLPNDEDGENDKNIGNHEVRSTSTSSHDSGFYGGGTAPISPKKAMETSYTYAQFQKTGKLTAPATVIPRFRKYNVDDFHFLTVLGKGSFGKVFLAELRNTEYYYAVKCLKKDVVLEDDDVDCTLIERKVLALGTKHPFLCHLFCTFQTDSHLFFVMEYLNGGDLMFHIQQSGRFQEARAKFYAAEIVSGLKFLHRKGIVYRDLKLDNVLLDYDGHVRIADFGMCKLEIYLDRLADSFCGTPDYMAPEIIKGQKYNQAVDWWSFGVLVYEMLVGQSPFSGCDEDELFWSICNEIPWFPHFLSKEALKLLQSLLEKDATIRLGCFNTMDEDGDIKYHPFFETIDWQKLERRGMEPPFKPQVRHPLDTQYFDKQFTRERARLTPIDRNILASMNQTQFEGFTYTNPNNTLTKLRKKKAKKEKKLYFCPQCGDIKVTYNVF